MMSSPPTNQYSKLHETLTRMPPNMVAAPDDKATKPSFAHDEEYQRPRRRVSIHRTSPPLPSDQAGTPTRSTTAARHARKSPLTSSLQSHSSLSSSSPPAAPLTPPAPTRSALPLDKSFTRDFFGTSKRKLRSSFFSKRNLKIGDDGDDSSDGDSADSLRDPLNLSSVILKRRDEGEGRRSNVPAALKQSRTESENSFDFDYTNLERQFYQRAAREEERRRWEEEEEDPNQQELQTQQEEGPMSSIQLETLQEHVMRRRGQEGAAEFRQGGALSTATVPQVAAPTVTWAATQTQATTIPHQQQTQRQEQGEDDASWIHDAMDTKKAVDEALAELQQFRPQDDGGLYRREEGRRLQGHETQEPRDGWHQDHNLAQTQQQRQNYPGSLRKLDSLRPSTTSAMTWEESSLMDDILRATEARGKNGEFLSRDEVLEELGISPSKAKENGDDIGSGRQILGQRQQEQSQWQEPQKPQPQSYEQSRRQELRPRQQDNPSHSTAQACKLQSIPDDETWIQEVLFSSNKQGYSTDIIKAILDSVPRECKGDEAIPSSLQQKEDTVFRDRETWMEDVERSTNVCPTVLQELMDARSGSESAHGTSSDMRRNDIYPTKPKHHTTVIQDMRGPIPTDDMLAESLMSHEGSESTGSRIIGDNVLIVSRKNRENQSDDIPLDILEAMGISDDSLVKESATNKGGGSGKISCLPRSSADDEVTAEDVLAQIGCDVDYESIPDHVLAALGLSKNQLRQVKSTNARNPSEASGKDASFASMKTSSVKKSVVASHTREQPCYFHRSCAEDDVSWVEDVHNPSNQVNTPATREFTGSSNTDSLTSSSLREFATDEHGPIPEADMLEEAFSRSSGKESLGGSLRSLKHVVEKEGHVGKDLSDERHQLDTDTSPSLSTPDDDDICGVIIEMKPSLGFMRHRYGTSSDVHGGGDNPQKDLELEAMKRRSEVLASIELCRSKLNRNQHERQPKND